MKNKPLPSLTDLLAAYQERSDARGRLVASIPQLELQLAEAREQLGALPPDQPLESGDVDPAGKALRKLADVRGLEDRLTITKGFIESADFELKRLAGEIDKRLLERLNDWKARRASAERDIRKQLMADLKPILCDDRGSAQAVKDALDALIEASEVRRWHAFGLASLPSDPPARVRLFEKAMDVWSRQGRVSEVFPR